VETSLDIQIRRRIFSLLEGHSTVSEFYRWFVPTTFQIERSSNPEAIHLTHRVAHLFSELSSGDLTPRELRHELDLAASTYVSTATPWNQNNSVIVTTSDSNDVTESPIVGFVVEQPRAAAAS
jgi:hypothetical protein